MSILRHRVEIELQSAAAVDGCGPLTAIDLADRVVIGGTREYKRRVIREYVRQLRKDRGLMICSSLVDGYWIARTATEYAAWQSSAYRREVFRFIEMKKNLERATDQRNGQGALFELGNNKGAFSQ